MATLKTIIIDTDAGGGHHYTGLAAALSGESGGSPQVVTSYDLVTNNEKALFDCRATSGTQDTTLVQINVQTFLTDSTRNVELTSSAGYRHSGKWDATKYRLVNESTSAYVMMLEVNRYTPFTIIRHLQFGMNHTATSYYNKGISVAYASSFPVISHNIVRGINPSKAGAGISLPDYCQGVVFNNLVYDLAHANGTGIYIGKTSSYYPLIYNNTVYGCTNGIGAANFGVNDALLINNVCMANSTSDITAYCKEDSDYNVSSDGTAPGAHSLTGKTSYGDYFNDYSARDFSLKGTGSSIWGSGGTSLSGSFTDDIIGTTRSAWDQGAFEYVSGGGGISGSLSATLAAIGLSSTGTLALKGALAKALDSIGLSAAGAVALKSALAKTLGELGIASTGKLAISGQLQKTLNAAGIVATGNLTLAAALAKTLDSIALAATGELASGKTGSLDKSLDPLGVAASGILAIKGAADITLGGLILLAYQAGTIKLDVRIVQAIIAEAETADRRANPMLLSVASANPMVIKDSTV